MSDPGIRSPQLAQRLSAAYRTPLYGEQTCVGCISNINGECRITGAPADAQHVCNSRMTEKEAQFLAGRLHEALFGGQP